MLSSLGAVSPPWRMSDLMNKAISQFVVVVVLFVVVILYKYFLIRFISIYAILGM